MRLSWIVSDLYGMRVCIGVSACSEFICTVCVCVFLWCICMDRVYMYKRVSIGVCMRQVYMYAQVIHIVYAFTTNIICIGMDYILVCTYISYIYFEHPIVYMCIYTYKLLTYTCIMCVLISEV